MDRETRVLEGAVAFAALQHGDTAAFTANPPAAATAAATAVVARSHAKRSANAFQKLFFEFNEKVVACWSERWDDSLLA